MTLNEKLHEVIDQGKRELAFDGTGAQGQPEAPIIKPIGQPFIWNHKIKLYGFSGQIVPSVSDLLRTMMSNPEAHIFIWDIDEWLPYREV